MQTAFKSTFLAFRWSFPTRLTFDVEIHGLADISSNVVADSTQVEATVFFQHMLDEQRAVDQHLDPKAWVEGNGFELGDPGACQRTRSDCYAGFDQNTRKDSLKRINETQNLLHVCYKNGGTSIQYYLIRYENMPKIDGLRHWGGSLNNSIGMRPYHVGLPLLKKSKCSL